jgi:ATP-dependent protease ClpP protease subunit
MKSPQSKRSKVQVQSASTWFRVRNLHVAADSAPVEILIYDVIGKDYFDDTGVGAHEFALALKEIPQDREILLRIHSPGGSAWDGLAIYHQLLARREYVTAQIDGVAFSAASFIAMAAKTVRMPRTARMMIHDASGFSWGNAEEMRKLADLLDDQSDNIAAIYAEKTRLPAAHIRELMRQTTWMTGSQALSMGFADEVTEAAVLNCAFDLSCFQPDPRSDERSYARQSNPQSAISNQQFSISNHSTPSPTPDSMNRKKLIAVLNKHGIQFDDKASDESLLALLDSIPASTPVPIASAPSPIAPAVVPPLPTASSSAAEDPKIIKIRADLDTMRSERDAERKLRVTASVIEAVAESRIPANQQDNWVRRALADETVLNDLRELPSRPPGGEPVSVGIENLGDDPKNIERAVLSLWGKGIHGPVDSLARAKARAEIINKNMSRILPVMNTNTVSSDLKRTVILQQMIRAFAIRVLPLSAFSTVFAGIKLEGTDKVAVPYFALDTTASHEFVAANGYDTFGNTNSDAKAITVDNRFYQGLSWTSSELIRQPFMDVAMGAMLKAEQLGLDVVNDVLSLVTAATYGAASLAGAAAAFDSDDVIDLKGVADLANWPASGRSMVLNSAFDINLLKDSAVKSANQFGDSAPIREGRIVRIGGFDYFPDARIPANGEALQGFICFKSAILVAFSPVGPTPEVRAQLARYEVVTEPTTGATFEYRLWGDPDMDTTREIIEANYGMIAGEPTALKRITT